MSWLDKGQHTYSSAYSYLAYDKLMYNTVNVTAGELLLTFFVSLSVAPSGQFE